MTATPHNGKEADFQHFMALLDGDRFEGKFRDGVHQADASDLMRRLVKEKIFKFDGTPLFPERIASTVSYALLFRRDRACISRWTEYAREEFRSGRSADERDGRKGDGWIRAHSSLQRRLASSPEAIHQSLKRRRESDWKSGYERSNCSAEAMKPGWTYRCNRPG